MDDLMVQVTAVWRASAFQVRPFCSSLMLFKRPQQVLLSEVTVDPPWWDTKCGSKLLAGNNRSLYSCVPGSTFYLTAGVSDLARLFVNTSKYAGTDL